MRVTNNTLTNNMLRHLNAGLSRLDRYQQQLASGKRVLKPSDDPAAVINILELRTSLMENNQLLKNVDTAASWLNSTDTVLASISSVLHRAKELTIYAATDTLSSDDRAAIQREMEQLFDNLLQLANSTHNGKYIFAGQKSTTEPFQRVSSDPADPNYYRIVYHGGTAAGDTSALKLEISANAVIDINIIQSRVNADGENEDQLFTPIFSVLAQIISDLEQGDVNELGGKYLEALELALDEVLSSRAEVGAKLNRIELAEERLKDLEINLNKLLSNVQDIDVAEKIMDLKSEENAYRIALAVGVRIIQPTLVDFLK
mgnify:CR=1 FL=1